MRTSNLILLIIISILITAVTSTAYPFAEDNSGLCAPDSEACVIDGTADDADIENIVESMHSHDEDRVCILYFYSPSCSHCNSMKPFLNSLFEEYEKNISVLLLDVSKPENIAMYHQMCSSKEYAGNEIPLIAINDEVLVGENQIRDNLEKEIIKGIADEHKICPAAGMECIDSGAGGTQGLLPGVKKISFFAVLPLVIITGLGDGINPCAFAILLFIMAFLQEISGSKKRLKRVTLSYIFSFMIFNIGLGILYYFTSVQLGNPGLIRNIAIGFAIFAGLINFKDFFAYGKGFSLEIPKFSKKYIESLAAKVSVTAALIMGFLVAILEAPCSLPIYLTVLEVLKSQGRTIIGVMPYIIIYNIMFIIPIAVLAVFIYFGAEAKALEGWRKKYRKFMKLSLGLILLLLAGLMIFGVI